jgi:iron complex outermembrane receptor protein
VTAYRGLDTEGTLDGDFSPSELYVGFNFVESDSFTQELRIKSKDTKESFKWLLGLYYSNEDKEYETGYDMDRTYADMLGVPLYAKDKHSALIEAEDMAVFGQSTLRFYDDAMGLTAGLRYENSERTLDHQHTFAGSPAAASINGLKFSNSELLPKVALDYRANDNIMTYASFARGYKAGGFAYAVDDPELASFDPEVSNAFEIGLKTEFPEHGLRVNVVGFYTDVDDYQDKVRYDAVTAYQTNVTETQIYGAELEASYALTDEFSLNGFFGYTHAEYGEYINALTGENYEGNLVEGIPEYDFGLFLEYRNRLGMFVRTEMQGFGSYYLSRENSMEQDPYSLYNAKIGYESENWDAYLTVQNITDEQYFLQAIDMGDIGWIGSAGPARTFALSLNYRF